MNPAIVIPAYKRNFSLERLLDSISKAHFPADQIPLVISIDGGGNPMVELLAKDFEWKFGPKKIIIQKENLGLKEHIYLCSDLVSEFENIILLEDDLVVSPYFYEYALKALVFYKNDPKIGGISLYNYEVTEHLNQPFRPIDDGSDVYFLQTASSWGQMFTKDQWEHFRNWNKNNEQEFSKAHLPKNVKVWGKNSWKKHFIHYLVENDLYFVYPRLSLTTNFEEIGVHSANTGQFQTSLQQSNRNYLLCNLSESKAIYDAWFEITPGALNKWLPQFQQFDYEVDLYGTKDSFKTEFALTVKDSTNVLFGFSARMKPLLQNVVAGIGGNSIGFSLAANIKNRADSKGSQHQVSVVVPILKFNQKELYDTLDSIFKNGYHNKIVVISVYQKEYNKVYKFIINEFLKNRFEIYFVEVSTKSLSACIKKGFSIVKGGITTWLHPGSVIMENDFIEANKVFNSFRQVNWLLPVSFNSELDGYRINREVIFHLLEKGAIQLNTELLFFRANCWKTISKQLKREKTEAGNFYSWLLFLIVWDYDLYPLVSDVGAGRRGNHSLFTSISSTQLWENVNRRNFLGSRKKMKGRLMYNLLRALSKMRFPLFRNFYYLYYDLPLVIRKDEKNQGYYFTKK